MPYTLSRLAPGSYDVLRDGEIVASLVSNGETHQTTWTVELLKDCPPEERPAPFTDTAHTFQSFKQAWRWLEGHEPHNARVENTSRQDAALPVEPTPADPSSMRERLPYAKWTFSDGLEVLLNRDYEPIWHRLPGQRAKASRLRPSALAGTKTSEIWFYSDATAPWLDETSRARCEQALDLFLS